MSATIGLPGVSLSPKSPNAWRAIAWTPAYWPLVSAVSRLRVRAQLRLRQEASGDGVRRVDAAGFGIDQLQKACYSLFQVALTRKEWARCFQEDYRSMFSTFVLPDWNTFHRALAFGHWERVPVLMDTS